MKQTVFDFYEKNVRPDMIPLIPEKEDDDKLFSLVEDENESDEKPFTLPEDIENALIAKITASVSALLKPVEEKEE